MFNYGYFASHLEYSKLLETFNNPPEEGKNFKVWKVLLGLFVESAILSALLAAVYFSILYDHTKSSHVMYVARVQLVFDTGTSLSNTEAKSFQNRCIATNVTRITVKASEVNFLFIGPKNSIILH